MRDKTEDNLPRESIGAPCDCGGYADIADEEPTKEEIVKYDCGRTYACCIGVFKCRICGKEFIAGFHSPDYN